MESGTVKRAFETAFFCCENEIFNLPLPTTEKLIYMVLTRYAGSNKRAWPAYDTLAKDASCSRRRAIQAVELLCNCRLVVKEKRGNRSNNYLVYPPNYYCAKTEEDKDTEIKKGANSAPQKNELLLLYHQGANSAPIEVNQVHHQGANSAPQGCNPCTLRVNELHPKSNSKSNKKNIISKNDNQEESNSFQNKIIEKEIKEEDIQAIKKAFKAKKSEVRDLEIIRLLYNYPVRDVKAAIYSCDFDVSRNPVAVIRWMLANGCYVMPAENEVISSQQEEIIQEVSDEEVRRMFAETKAQLLSKV